MYRFSKKELNQIYEALYLKITVLKTVTDDIDVVKVNELVQLRCLIGEQIDEITALENHQHIEPQELE